MIPALSLHGHPSLGPILLCETYKKHGMNKPPRVLIDLAWKDAGYCLDAPDLLPAGGCRSENLDDDMVDVPMQITVER
jgi:hypothetical protein